LAQARNIRAHQAEVGGDDNAQEDAQENPTRLHDMTMEMLHSKGYCQIAASWVPDHDVAFQSSMCF